MIFKSCISFFSRDLISLSIFSPKHFIEDSGIYFPSESSITNRFTRDEFYEFSEPTIGAAFTTKTLELESRKIRFEIWDTAGQERYHSLAPMYYRGAKAAIVVYDITSNHSFQKAKLWVQELQQSISEIVISLVGNKIDLESQREVLRKDAQEYAEEHQLLFVETSAKNDQNITSLFQEIGKTLPREQTFSLKAEKIDYISSKNKCGGC